MTEKKPASFVDNYLLYLLARASEQASRQFHAQVKRHGLKVPEWRVLAAISDRPQNIGELAKITLYQQPTLTKVVERMVADDLVQKTRDRNDKRIVRVQITAKGQATFNNLRGAALAHETQVLSQYTEKESTHLKGLLKQLIARTDEKRDS
jgi:MarR family transcriptional regulator, organic hydroperoxide resistance regulator